MICSSVESTAGESLSVGDLSALVQALVKADRCGEASKVVLGMLEKGIYPASGTLRFLVNRLAIAGDIDTLTAIGNLLTPVSIAKISCWHLQSLG
jgi:leucine-rich PPR motif-containing protein